jgi:hypothetical protein
MGEAVRRTEIMLWVINGAAALTGAAYSKTYLRLEDPFFIGVWLLSVLMALGLYLHFKGFGKFSLFTSAALSVLSALYFMVEPRALFVELGVILVVSLLLTAVGIYALVQKRFKVAEG